ncbi:MAG: helix-turn-helix domain-containing protein [Saprospiraceae bacterium]|nr:helix-turn-helix domain-containing protein [Saprospiraceae bacterium]
MSADPDNEYFSDGITEEIINALTTVRGLKVIARTSSFAFKNKNIDVRTIGSQLGVNMILEGSVRKAKNRVRITAQLVSTNDGTHFWSRNFDRDLEDIFSLQDEVSELIADQIRENFGHLEIPAFHETGPTKKVNAYDLWLRGNYHLKRKDFDDIKEALELFKKAIEIDPDYSSAYSSLGEAYIHAAGFGLMTNTESKHLAGAAAERAVALDARNAQGHKVLAYVKLFHEWDWASALQEYERAVKNGLPDQNEFIGYYYIFIEKDYERAIKVAQKVLETDPLHVITHWQLGLAYYFARQFENAQEAFSGALVLDPKFGEALRFRGLVRGYLGDYPAALADINRSLEISGGQGLANMDLLMVKILMGEKEEVLSEVQKTNYSDAADTALLYSLLNMPDEAIYWLEKAYQEHSGMMVTLKNFWVWDNLRGDLRFQKIYDQMNFPPDSASRNTSESTNVDPRGPGSTPLLNEKEIKIYLQQLDELINNEKIFTDSSLSLRQLAEKMGLHPNKLSWLLNEHMDKNFNEYINAFRLETFKQKALDPANSHLTLLGLAYESGFNSKTAFNAFFKKSEGVSPRAWVKSKSK